MGKTEGGSLSDYLNARSSLTFGASAAMVVAFTSTLCSAFPLPAAIVAISLSGILAAVQVSNAKDRMLVRLLFWFLCTMVIFHAARGGNTTIGEASGANSAPKEIVVPDAQSSVDLMGLFVPTAYAADTNRYIRQSKYFLWKVDEEGRKIYTNSVGTAHTNRVRTAFDQWNWRN